MTTATKTLTPAFWLRNPGNTPKGTRRDFVPSEWIPWTPWILPNAYFRLFYCNFSTGQFTIMLRVDKVEQPEGAISPSHWHAANLQGYILEGGFFYSEGEDRGEPGSYICEVGGAVHAPYAPEGLLMLLISDGPIVAYNLDGEVEAIGDAALHYYLARENGAVEHTTVVDYVGAPASDLH